MKQTFEVYNVKCGGCANTLIKSLKDEFGEVVVDLLARFFGLGDFLLDLVVGFGVFVFEGEVFQLGLYGEQS